MPGKRLSVGLRATLAMFTVTLLLTSTWAATEKKLHNFVNGTDAASPYAPLIFDAAGNLYGTSAYGGDYTTCASGAGCGTVFELMPNGSGGWTERKLHNFGNGTDGTLPVASLIFDAAGNLYGTTYQGGDYPCGGQGCGTVFELTPNGSGGWTEKKLHNFGNGTDGVNPVASLIFDTAGNLYGTTYGGGDYDYGTVFELTPNGSGGWTEKKLHNFNGRDGENPDAGLIFDAAGNLYGTTIYGGAYWCRIYGCGTVFELMPNGSGGWTEKKLHNFDGTNGANPNAGLIFDAAGNLYGVTYQGGDYLGCDIQSACGTVFELMPDGSGGWTKKVLHYFDYTDGTNPSGGLILDAAGNLYGTTEYGGDYLQCGGVGDGMSCGTVFEMTPNGEGGWAVKKLHNFGNGTDGAFPAAGLIFDAAGNFYGTTSQGGDYPCRIYGCGTVFEITP